MVLEKKKKSVTAYVWGRSMFRKKKTEFNRTVPALPGFLPSRLNLPLVYSKRDARHSSVTKAGSFHQTHLLFFLGTN